MTTVTIGKARIQIDVKGCIDCGTEHSSGWEHVESVLVVVKKRHVAVDLGRCADCAKKKAPTQMEIGT